MKIHLKPLPVLDVFGFGYQWVGVTNLSCSSFFHFNSALLCQLFTVFPFLKKSLQDMNVKKMMANGMNVPKSIFARTMWQKMIIDQLRVNLNILIIGLQSLIYCVDPSIRLDCLGHSSFWGSLLL